VVDAEGERRGEGRAESEFLGGRDTTAESGGALADAEGARPQGQRSDHREAGWPHADGSAGLGGGALEILFAPGPGDGRWPEIIGAAPDLEPAVCRVAHGLADRVDRLRACGNGVVPLAAAYAWRALDALLDESRAADANGVVVTAAA
jgi:DNA (cytosine-5)-methyltransferase 1